MKNKVISATIIALCLSTGAPAFAQGHNDRDNDRGRGQHAQRDNDRGRGQQVQRGNQRGQFSRGAGPRNDMHRGGRLSHDYRSNQYVVNDWRGHHLSAPPRGQHWVQTGGDYVLVAIATGIILNMVLDN